MVKTPVEVRALAQRCGASQARPKHRVTLRQAGEMRDGPDGRWTPFRAEQSISLSRPAFRWTARTGPLGLVTVVDALRGGEPHLEARAFGVVTLVRPPVTAALTKGELMRYLAELPWAPDAMLHNRALAWQVLNPGRLRVSAACGEGLAAVDLHLGDDGLVAAVSAADRPRMEGRRTVERPWWGRFCDYRSHAGRRLPFRAEVGWRLQDREVAVWRGLVTAWSMG